MSSPSKRMRARGGAEDAGDGAKGGGFPRAIGADERDDAAGRDGNAEIVNGGDGAIGYAEVFGFEHRAGQLLLELTF